MLLVAGGASVQQFIFINRNFTYVFNKILLTLEKPSGHGQTQQAASLWPG